MALLITFSVTLMAAAVESAPEAFTTEDRRILEIGFRSAFHYHPISAEVLDEPRALLAPDEMPHAFRVIPETGPESEETHRFVGIGETPERTRFEYHLNASESQLMSLSEGQGVVIEGAIDRKEGVKTEFQPPKPLIPQSLSPGQSLSAVTKVRVLELTHLEKVRHSGELHLTLTHLGSFHVKVPSGEYGTVLVRLDSRGKIGPAEIDHRQYYFFAEDTGLVAFLEVRRVSAFGIYEKKDQSGLVLIREGEGL